MLKPTLVPGRTLRVGIVGVSRLDPSAIDHLRQEVDRLLRDVDNQATLDGEETMPAMEILCTLAEGAERLVTDWAIKAGYQLTCVLPFRQATYEADFSGADSIAAFRTLLERAEGQVLELDGSRSDERRAYEAAARMVVRNSDLIIAVWDGRTGGPRDVAEFAVRLAAESGPPVALLYPSARAPALWIESPHDLVVALWDGRAGGRRATAGAAMRPDREAGASPEPMVSDVAHRAVEWLPLYVHRLMTLPDPPEPGMGVLHATARTLRRLVTEPTRIATKRGPSQPVLDFLTAPEPVVWVPLLLHDRLMAVFGWVPSPAPNRLPDTDPPTLPPEADPWSLWFGHADRQARMFESRDRTACLLGFIAAAVALAAIALRPLPATDGAWAIGLEAGGAALAALLVIADGVFGWHAKARSYRLVAEFCRIQQMLAPLGWCIPRPGGWATGARERTGDWRLPGIAPIAWEAWLYGAWLRDVRVPFGTMDRDRIEMSRDSARFGILQERMETLQRDAVRQHQVGLRLRLVAEACLLATLAIAIARFQMDGDMAAAIGWLGRPSAVLPAVAIGLLGYAAWTRLRGHAQTATLAVRAVRRTQRRIGEIDCAAPLASQVLGAELAALGQTLMAATPGWDALTMAGVDGADPMFDPLADAAKAKAKLSVTGMDDDPPEAPPAMPPQVPLERLPRYRVPRGKIRLRRR